MGEFHKSAKVSEIPPGTSKVVQVGNTPVGIFNVGGNYHAIHNTCLHRQGPLGEGELEDTTVTCPWHGWRYNVTTGECLTRPGARVPCFEVRVEGEHICVKT